MHQNADSKPLQFDMRQFVRDHGRGIIVWLLLAIMSGPLSSLGDYLVGAAKSFSIGLTIVISVISSAFVTVIYLWLFARNQAKKLARQVAEQERQYADLQGHSEAALLIADKLVRLDDSLLRLLPGLGPITSRADVVRRVLEDYLHDASHVFEENVSRATILRPDGEYLLPWVSYQMPQTSLNTMRFYVGPVNDRLRGVAGKAFLMRRVHTVHIANDAQGNWIADDTDYQVFDNRRVQKHSDPPYRSFVAIPILGESHDCLGVLCFDSASQTAFDSDIENLFLALGNRIAAIILLDQALS